MLCEIDLVHPGRKALSGASSTSCWRCAARPGRWCRPTRWSARAAGSSCPRCGTGGFISTPCASRRRRSARRVLDRTARGQLVALNSPATFPRPAPVACSRASSPPHQGRRAHRPARAEARSGARSAQQCSRRLERPVRFRERHRQRRSGGGLPTSASGTSIDEGAVGPLRRRAVTACSPGLKFRCRCRRQGEARAGVLRAA